MVTVLLQEIRDLLGTLATTVIETLITIAEKLDLLDTIEDELSNIETDADTIANNSGSIDGKLTDTNGYLANIETNTGSVVTPVTLIKSGVDTVVTKQTAIATDISAISGYMNTISTNSGVTAGFTEDVATNTLNCYNKLVTIASDTTQMRADNQQIISLLQQIVTNTTPTP